MFRFPKSFKPATALRERQLEDERMRDVQMLLESLFLREEVTVRLIADCLYDVGSINLLNQQVRSRPLNRLLKVVARNSKPVFRFFMVRWTRQNCPQLITKWLHSQVIFAPSEVLLPEVLAPEGTESLSIVRGQLSDDFSSERSV